MLANRLFFRDVEIESRILLGQVLRAVVLRKQRVAKFVDDLATDPRKTATLHQWVYL